MENSPDFLENTQTNCLITQVDNSIQCNSTEFLHANEIITPKEISVLDKTKNTYKKQSTKIYSRLRELPLNKPKIQFPRKLSPQSTTKTSSESPKRPRKGRCISCIPMKPNEAFRNTFASFTEELPKPLCKKIDTPSQLTPPFVLKRSPRTPYRKMRISTLTTPKLSRSFYRDFLRNKFRPKYPSIDLSLVGIPPI